MTMSIPPEAFLPSGLGLLDHDARDALRRTRTPSMVVVGTRDLLTRSGPRAILAGLLEGSRLMSCRAPATSSCRSVRTSWPS